MCSHKGRVYGIAVDGLGQVSVLVPKELAEEAKHMIEPQEIERAVAWQGLSQTPVR